jgi:hypothetical protein
MKKVINWVQFTWDLSALPDGDSELPEHYQITAATHEDEKELRKCVSSSFSLDPEWNTMMHEVTPTIETWLAKALESDTNVGLVLRHGVRIIGATVLSLEPEADNHLSPGPCIMMEYRNRGFGTAMLERSLRTLREAGLTRAIGIAKDNSPVTKFLYPKFDGTPTPYESSPLIAA